MLLSVFSQMSFNIQTCLHCKFACHFFLCRGVLYANWIILKYRRVERKASGWISEFGLILVSSRQIGQHIFSMLWNKCFQPIFFVFSILAMQIISVVLGMMTVATVSAAGQVRGSPYILYGDVHSFNIFCICKTINYKQKHDMCSILIIWDRPTQSSG